MGYIIYVQVLSLHSQDYQLRHDLHRKVINGFKYNPISSGFKSLNHGPKFGDIIEKNCKGDDVTDDPSSCNIGPM